MDKDSHSIPYTELRHPDNLPPDVSIHIGDIAVSRVRLHNDTERPYDWESEDLISIIPKTIIPPDNVCDFESRLLAKQALREPLKPTTSIRERTAKRVGRPHRNPSA